MIIRKYDIQKFIILLSIVLLFFSSTCLWSETNLGNYLRISILIVVISAIVALVGGFSINRYFNHRYVLWVIVTYSIFEIYGLLFLRIGEFNWDFVLFSGILQLSLIASMLTLNNIDDLLNVFCKGCKWALLFVCLFMVSQGSLSLSNIAFGARLGDELSGNVNTVATNIGIMLIPTLYLALKDSYKKNWTTWAILLFGVLCMVLTGSKKGILVLGIACVMYLVIVRTPLKFLIVPLAVIAAIYAIFNVSFLYNTIGFRIIDMFATFGIGTSVTSAQSTAIRNSLIEQGLRSFWNHPLLGGGMNYFQYINHARYYAHNNYVELLNDIGIIGTMIYYCPFISILFKMIKKIRVGFGNESDRKLYVFLVSFISVKFIMDWAMVSFSALCTFTIPFLFTFEALRMERTGGFR